MIPSFVIDYKNSNFDIFRLWYQYFFCFPFTAFEDKIPAAHSLNINKAICEEATDYTKRENVLRLRLKDGAEFLLDAGSQKEMSNWQEKLCYWAGKHVFYVIEVLNFFFLTERKINSVVINIFKKFIDVYVLSLSLSPFFM